MPRSLQCAIALMLTSRLSAQVAQMSDSEMRRVAARVSELDVRRQFPSATVATVDSLLAFYSDSVVYEHPSVDAVVRGKAALLAGMLQYMGSRPTTTIDAPRITIGARIAVLDVAAQVGGGYDFLGALVDAVHHPGVDVGHERRCVDRQLPLHLR